MTAHTKMHEASRTEGDVEKSGSVGSSDALSFTDNGFEGVSRRPLHTMDLKPAINPFVLREMSYSFSVMISKPLPKDVLLGPAALIWPT